MSPPRHVFSVQVPESHPHITMTFHVLGGRCVVPTQVPGPVEADHAVFAVAVADHEDLVRLDQPGQPLAAQLQEYAQSHMADRVLVIDAATEGWQFQPRVFDGLHRGLDAIGIDPRRVVVISTNHLLPAAYQGWAKQAGVAPVALFIYDFWCYKLSTLLREQSPHAVAAPLSADPVLTVDRKLLSLNRAPKAHRAAVVLQLIEDGQLDASLVSFIPDSAEVADATKAELLAYFSGLGWPVLTRLLKHWDALAARLPLVNDQDAGAEYLTYVFGDMISADYARVGFTVITESDFGVPEVDRVTEKPFKAIANHCPYLLVGQPRQLARLETLGFRSYSMFDNGYDAIEDPAPRLEAVLREQSRLSKTSLEGLQALRSEMRETAAYNFARLAEFSSPDMLDALARDLVQVVAAAQTRRAEIAAPEPESLPKEAAAGVFRAAMRWLSSSRRPV